MNIALLAGRIAHQAWTPGAIVSRLVLALSERGHTVSLIAESIEDPLDAAPCSSLSVFQDYEQSASAYPHGFSAWCSRRLSGKSHDVSLSLTHAHTGEIWWPTDPSPGSFLVDVLATKGQLGAAPTLAKHAGVLPASVSRTLRPMPPGPAPWLALGVGRAGREGAGLVAGPQSAGSLEFFSTLANPDPSRLDQARARTRAALGLSSDRLVLLVGATDRPGPWLASVLAEIQSANNQPMHPSGPAVIVLCREQFAVHEMCVQSGCDRHIRVVGMTDALHEVLAACDACALPRPAPLGPFQAGSTGRLAADALRFGRPLLCHSGHVAAELCSRRTDNADVTGAGIVVDAAPGSWRRALKRAADPTWLERASITARELARSFDFTPLVDLLEQRLASVADHRSRRRGPPNP